MIYLKRSSNRAVQFDDVTRQAMLISLFVLVNELPAYGLFLFITSPDHLLTGSHLQVRVFFKGIERREEEFASSLKKTCKGFNFSFSRAFFDRVLFKAQ